MGENGRGKRNGLGGVGERVGTYCEIATERYVLSRLAILDGASRGVGRGEWESIFGQAKDVDLEICEGMPKRWLHKRLEGRKLDDGH